VKGVIQIGGTRGNEENRRETGRQKRAREREEERERERERETERSGIPGAKQLPTLPARRGHIFTPQNVGRRATA
jgi:hypothetical protein